jgi:hypothetical protein
MSTTEAEEDHEVHKTEYKEQREVSQILDLKHIHRCGRIRVYKECQQGSGVPNIRAGFQRDPALDATNMRIRINQI